MLQSSVPAILYAAHDSAAGRIPYKSRYECRSASRSPKALAKLSRLELNSEDHLNISSSLQGMNDILTDYGA